jgi:hypothetical protein
MELESGFEDAAREALLEQFAEELTPPGGPAMTAIEHSQSRLRESEYDLDNIHESQWGPAVSIEGDRVEVSWGWAHGAAGFFETGTTAHEIDGDPVLTFVWEDPPQWVQEEFDPEGDGWRVFFDSVNVDGVDEIRFTREGLRVLERELS